MNFNLIFAFTLYSTWQRFMDEVSSQICFIQLPITGWIACVCINLLTEPQSEVLWRFFFFITTMWVQATPYHVIQFSTDLQCEQSLHCSAAILKSGLKQMITEGQSHKESEQSHFTLWWWMCDAERQLYWRHQERRAMKNIQVFNA